MFIQISGWVFTFILVIIGIIQLIQNYKLRVKNKELEKSINIYSNQQHEGIGNNIVVGSNMDKRK